MKKTAIIIVNWNGFSDTLVCLDSLTKLKTPAESYEIIVVDNGSTNDSVVRIRKKYPNIKILETGENRGFSGGNNFGLAYAMTLGFAYFWLLNNDTIADVNALNELLKASGDEKDNCILGSKIYFAAGHEFHHDRYRAQDRGKVFWYAGGIIDWQNMYGMHRGVDEIDVGQYDRKTDTDFISGCSMFFPEKVIRSVGFLNDNFFLYLEDLDYCLRARKLGFQLKYIPESKIWHINAGSTAKPGNELHAYYFTRNRLLIGIKYAPLRTKIALIREAISMLFKPDRIRRKAVMDALTGRKGRQYQWKIR